MPRAGVRNQLAILYNYPAANHHDIRRTKELLGWEPKVGLDEGLKRTIEYFRKKLG